MNGETMKSQGNLNFPSCSSFGMEKEKKNVKENSAYVRGIPGGVETAHFYIETVFFNNHLLLCLHKLYFVFFLCFLWSSFILGTTLVAENVNGPLLFIAWFFMRRLKTSFYRGKCKNPLTRPTFPSVFFIV